MDGKSRSIREDLLWGVSKGIAYGAAAALILSITRVARGPGAFSNAGVGYGPLFWLCLLVAFAGGAIVGLLRPLTRIWWGQALVGIVVVALVFGGFTALDSPHVLRWRAHEWRGVLVAAVIGGPAAAIGSASVRRAIRG